MTDLPVEAQARHLSDQAEARLSQGHLDKSPAGLVEDLEYFIFWLTYYHNKAVQLAAQAEV